MTYRERRARRRGSMFNVGYFQPNTPPKQIV